MKSVCLQEAEVQHCASVFRFERDVQDEVLKMSATETCVCVRA